MSLKTFEKILCLSEPDVLPVRWKANHGPLEVSESGIDFHGKRKPITIRRPFSVRRIHSGSWANDVMQVDFAEGEGFSSVFFVVPKYGQAAQRMVDELQSALEVAAGQAQSTIALTPTENEVLDRHRWEISEQQEVRSRRAKVIGAILIGVGIILIVRGNLRGLILIPFGIASLAQGFMSSTNIIKKDD